MNDCLNKVTAVDGGEPPLSSTATLTLIVEDLNDERPRFERRSYYLNVSENCPPGTSIGRVVALDPDASPRFARVLYRIRRRSARRDAFQVGRLRLHWG